MASSSSMKAKAGVDADVIQRAVRRIRGQNVMIDSDLALLYRVDVKVLNQAVKRNRERFPADFMFELTSKEAALLRSQFVTANASRGGRPLRSQIVTLDSGRGRHRKYPPKAFTEQGVAMLSSVLRSQRAVMVNIEIMRAFVQLRRMLGANEDLARKLDALERKYDGKFQAVFQAIRRLMAPSQPPRRSIGFRRDANA
jgi:ORF6N domain